MHMPLNGLAYQNAFCTLQ